MQGDVVIVERKWCKWCEKDTHNSSECWSTHVVPCGCSKHELVRHNQLNASLSRVTLATDKVLLELIEKSIHKAQQ